MTGPERVSAPTPRIFAAVGRRRGTAASASPVTTMRRPANTTKPKKRTVRPKETPTAIMPRRPTRSLWSVTAGARTGHGEHPRRRRRCSSQPCSIPATERAGCTVSQLRRAAPRCRHEPMESPRERTVERPLTRSRVGSSGHPERRLRDHQAGLRTAAASIAAGSRSTALKPAIGSGNSV